MNCPDGKEIVTSRRTDGSVFTRCLKSCPSGKTRSPATMRCKKDSTPNPRQTSPRRSRQPSPRQPRRTRPETCLPTEDFLEYTIISKKRGPEYGTEVTRRVCKKKCSPGYTRSPDTRRCKKSGCKDTHDMVIDPRTNKTKCLVKCKQGYARSETMKCKPDLRTSEKTMRQHQLRFISAFEKSLMNTGEDAKRGAILYHGVGTGKTLTAVKSAAVYFNSGGPEKNVLIICPASIVPVFQTEVNTVLSASEKRRTRIISFEGFSKASINRKRFLPAAVERACTENTLLIVDEAQRLATQASYLEDNMIVGADKGLSSTSFVMLECGRRVDRVLLLSATPMRNMVIDFVNLLTMIDPTITRQRFNECVVNRTQAECIQTLSRCMVSIEATDINNAAYPIVIAEDIGFVMTEAENEFYSRAMSNAISEKQILKEIMRFRKMHHRIHVHEQREGDEGGFYDTPVLSLDQPKLNWILWGNSFTEPGRSLVLAVRVYGDNTVTKREKITDFAHTPGHKGLCTDEYKKKPLQSVVYSVFVEDSVQFLYDELKKCGVKVGMIKGSVTPRNRDRIVKDYNEGKINVLIFTAAGSEGISLKNTRSMYLLQPDWNMARANQAIGRVRRFNSHADLPESKRGVSVYNLMLFRTQQEIRYYKIWMHAVEEPEATRTPEEAALVKQNIRFSETSVDHYMRWKSYMKQVEIDNSLRAIDQPYETCFSD